MGAGKLKVVCPYCKVKITLDQLTGAVPSHEQPDGGPAKTFEEAATDEKKRRRDASDRFTQAFHEHEHREEIFEKKFEEAVKRAEKDDKPPPRPFDFD